MPDPEITRLALAVFLQAPFAFRLGYVVSDGRELLFGGLFLALPSAATALICFLSGGRCSSGPAPPWRPSLLWPPPRLAGFPLRRRQRRTVRLR